MLVLDAFKRHLTQEVIWWHDITTTGVRHGHQQAFQRPTSSAVKQLAPRGEPCPHSRWKTEEALSNYVGGMDPDYVREDFQRVNCC
jgi:hypothetical protein